MNDAAAPLPCAGSEHLSVLVDEIDRLADRLRHTLASGGSARTAARRAEEDAASADATLLLDGGLRGAADGSGQERAGTWLDALGGIATTDDLPGDVVDDPPDEADGPAAAALDSAALERMAELERAGVVAGIASEDLAEAFGRASADAGGLGTAIAVLHARLTSGLVAEERAGRLRRGPRVVHDASVGRVLFFPTDPAVLPDAWDQLLRHVTGSGAGGAGARLPSAVRAALLHLELLRHQPFDAANGRLARAAARLALRADGLLPGGLGAPDVVLAEDTLGYHEEVGASVRRRDATLWVERALEAHGAALRRTLDALEGSKPATGGDAGDVALDAPPTDDEGRFTLGDVVATESCTSSVARARCSTLVVAGRAERIVGSSGLRLRLR
jgi:hypothetical protein